MKIVELKAKNIKKLKAVEITPKNNLVKISGKNAQGKTSVLDSIVYALAGKKAIPSKPIRDGEKNAKIELNLGDFKITRTFTKSGTYLKVITKDGAEYPKAQEKLSDLASNISFDPLEFANKSSKEQVKILTELLGISEKLDEIDSEYKGLYEERTFINRDLKEAQAVVKQHQKPDDKYFKMEKIDVFEVSKKLEQEREKYFNIERLEKHNEKLESDIEEVKNQIKELERKKNELLLAQEETYNNLQTAKKEFDLKYSQDLKSELESAEETNQKIEDAKNYTRSQGILKQEETKKEEIEKQIQANRGNKDKLIKNSKMPIEGIGINEDGLVTYKEIPFEQLSGAERLKVSVSIAMASNPELRIATIRDGSLLDEDNMKVLQEMCDKEDFMILLEIVDSSGEIGFYIEDGEVRKEN